MVTHDSRGGKQFKYGGDCGLCLAQAALVVRFSPGKAGRWILMEKKPFNRGVVRASKVCYAQSVLGIYIYILYLRGASRCALLRFGGVVVGWLVGGCNIKIVVVVRL